MMPKIEIKRISYSEIEFMRFEYLNHLTKFQDIFLEFFINHCKCYACSVNEQIVGYGILTENNILIEFFVTNNYQGSVQEIFLKLISNINFESIYCKSFDPVMLICCETQKLKPEIIGYLYRDLIRTEIKINSSFITRYASPQDLNFLKKQNDEVFEPKEQLDTFVKNKNIIIFEVDKKIAGCGFITRVNKNYCYYDIGMWVNPQFRKKGIATQIISHLIKVCSNNKWIPICGCDKDNIASQKTLEKNGFIRKEVLYKFTL